MGILLTCSLGTFSNCSFPVRSGYDRTHGKYKPTHETSIQVATSHESTQDISSTSHSAATPSKSQTTDEKSSANVNVAKEEKNIGHRQDSLGIQRVANRDSEKNTVRQPQNNTKPAASARPTNLEKYAKEWLGAKYVYGAASKQKTDCSGYVMQVYKGFYGISLDHNAESIYDDDRGSSIRRNNLKEGDLIFFGNFWRINHVGIYLKGNRFIHASTSKGVIISSMNDNYWAPKYKGARRFK